MWFWNHYVGVAPDKNPYHSPLLAKSLANLPPALVQVAGMDPLRDEGIGYAAELKTAGNKVQLEVFKGLPHGFGNLFMTSSASKYQENVVAFIKAIGGGIL